MKKWIAGLFATTVLGGGAVFGADSQINPYDDKGTHYELSITSDIPQGERVEIAKDRAAMTMKGWNDEYAITIEPQIPTAALGAVDRPFTVQADRKLLSKKLEYKSGDVTAFIEPRATSSEFDIDFTLHAKPETNVFTYKIQGADDFDFFYQPALTPEEIAEGAERPENAVGSYAVYHKTKANHRVGSTNYATGKAFHIYRPKAIDANGAETWAELAYLNGTLSVTVPQKFLDDAVYPVRVDPTFGYTTAGASTVDIGSGGTRGSKETVTGTGSVTKITVYLNGWGAGELVKTALYNDNTSKQAESNERSDGGADGWYDFTITGSITASSVYGLTGFAGSAMNMKYDTGSGRTYVFGAATYPTFPSSLTNSVTRSHSIYATYTASSPSTATTTPTFKLDNAIINTQGTVNIQ